MHRQNRHSKKMKIHSASPTPPIQREEIRDSVTTADSARERTVMETVTTEMETEEMAADSVREDHRAAREHSVETETVTAREDLQDRETARTEDLARGMETAVDSVRATTVTTEMETEEMAADLAREDHRAARDASVAKMKAVTAVQKVALEDRSHRDSVPVVPEEAEVQMLSLHQS